MSAQEPGPADPVIRVSVDLVQLDAVVRDSSGRHGRNLPADEFEILEDGKPQKITHFLFVPGGEPGSAVAPGKGEKVVAGGAPAAPMLTRDQVHRTVVLWADDLGMSAESMPRMKNALANVVAQNLLEDDLLSLMAASGGMGSMQQFTSASCGNRPDSLVPGLESFQANSCCGLGDRGQSHAVREGQRRYGRVSGPAFSLWHIGGSTLRNSGDAADAGEKCAGAADGRSCPGLPAGWSDRRGEPGRCGDLPG